MKIEESKNLQMVTINNQHPQKKYLKSLLLFFGVDCWLCSAWSGARFSSVHYKRHPHTHTKGRGFIGKWVISKSKLAPSTIDRTPAKMLAGGDCSVCPLPIKHYEWPQFAVYKSDEKNESKNDPILLIWRPRYNRRQIKWPPLPSSVPICV